MESSSTNLVALVHGPVHGAQPRLAAALGEFLTGSGFRVRSSPNIPCDALIPALKPQQLAVIVCPLSCGPPLQAALLARVERATQQFGSRLVVVCFVGAAPDDAFMKSIEGILRCFTAPACHKLMTM